MRYRRTYLKLVRRQDDGEPAVVLPPEEIPNELGSTLSGEEWPEGQAPKRAKKPRSLTPDQKLVAALRGESDEGAYVDRDYITLWRSFLSSCPTYDRFEEATTEHPNGLIVIQGVYARVSRRRTTEFGLSCALNVPMQVTSRQSGFTTTHSCLWIGFERRRDGVRRIDDYVARVYPLPNPSVRFPRTDRPLNSVRIAVSDGRSPLNNFGNRFGRAFRRPYNYGGDYYILRDQLDNL